MSNIKIKRVACGAVGTALLLLDVNAALAEPAAQGPDWKISSKTSALDGTTRYSGMLDAVGKIPNSIGRPETVTLIVRCVPGSGLSSYIAWPLYMGSKDLEVVYRFNQAPVQHGLWSISEDGRALGMFERSGALTSFLAQLGKARCLVVQAPSYQSLPVEAEFDLGDVATVVAAAQKACA